MKGNAFNDIWKIEFADDAERERLISAASDEPVAKLLEELDIKGQALSVDELIEFVLSEKYYRGENWNLKFTHMLYYFLKAFLPKGLTRHLRNVYQKNVKVEDPYRWPLDERYVGFIYSLARLIHLEASRPLRYLSFWPNGKRFAFILTHDVETEEGFDNILRIIDAEQSFGFSSSFNIVPEKYRIDPGVIREIKNRGFEIGIHGLKHDGKLFLSRKIFLKRAAHINNYLLKYAARGFRAPLTHRNPKWLKEINAFYDSSFFDTDPFEPLAGGTMSIWPFFIGDMVELPYTLMQDHTLFEVMGQKSPSLWIEKIEFIQMYRGMALLNTHPDYLKNNSRLGIYREFLETISERSDYWHALPFEAARWWSNRSGVTPGDESEKPVNGAWADGAVWQSLDDVFRSVA